MSSNLATPTYFVRLDVSFDSAIEMLCTANLATPTHFTRQEISFDYKGLRKFRDLL